MDIGRFYGKVFPINIAAGTMTELTFSVQAVLNLKLKVTFAYGRRLKCCRETLVGAD